MPAPAYPTSGIGALGDRFDGVERIAVLRGGGLGDVVFALPAIEALATAYPDAEILLLGSPSHAALFDERPSAISDVIVLPFSPGVRDGGDEDPRAIEAFIDRVGAVDLAVQVHGGGRNSNPFLTRLNVRHTIGLATADAPQLERTLPYVYYQHEVLRALEVVALAGAAPVALEPRIEVTEQERADAGLRRLADRLVVLHPGATDVRRRWPAERFGDIAARLARDRVQVLVVGDESDAAAADAIVDTARASTPAAGGLVASVAGRISLSELIGLASVADVFLGNDSGPRHLAQAAGAPTVGIFWIGNVINAGPFGRGRNRVQLSWTTRCPVCGRDVTQVGWTAPRCEHDLSFVTDVTVDGVYDDVRALLESR